MLILERPPPPPPICSFKQTFAGHAAERSADCARPASASQVQLVPLATFAWRSGCRVAGFGWAKGARGWLRGQAYLLILAAAAAAAARGGRRAATMWPRARVPPEMGARRPEPGGSALAFQLSIKPLGRLFRFRRRHRRRSRCNSRRLLAGQQRRPPLEDGGLSDTMAARQRPFAWIATATGQCFGPHHCVGLRASSIPGRHFETRRRVGRGREWRSPPGSARIPAALSCKETGAPGANQLASQPARAFGSLAGQLIDSDAGEPIKPRLRLVVLARRS